LGQGEVAMSGVQSFERELGILFERWLAEVERRLGHPVDRDAAFEAWASATLAVIAARSKSW
jgi:hypothetical protein